MARNRDVLLYGATGFTGRLIAAQLASRKLRFAIAGRESESLHALGARLGVTVFSSELGDAAALDRAFSSASVVMAAAGPFAKTGAALVEAALRTRTHLIDVSGEPAYLRETRSRDLEARDAGVAIVHSVGFDVLPAELLAQLCQKPLGALETLSLGTAHVLGSPSHGTLQSYLTMASGAALSFIEGQLVDEPLGAHRRVIEFSPPVGARAATSIGSAEVVLLARSLPARNVIHYLGTLAPVALSVAERAAPTFSVQALEQSLVKLREAGLRGPDEAARRQNAFSLWCQAETADGRSRTMTLDGVDPYGLSAVLAVAAAGMVSDPGFRARGVLTPLQALEAQPLLAAMANVGVRWRAIAPQ